jgi:hypothetical protein
MHTYYAYIFQLTRVLHNRSKRCRLKGSVRVVVASISNLVYSYGTLPCFMKHASKALRILWPLSSRSRMRNTFGLLAVLSAILLVLGTLPISSTAAPLRRASACNSGASAQDFIRGRRLAQHSFASAWRRLGNDCDMLSSVEAALAV